MDQILEIIKSDKVLKQVVERVNQDSQIDMAALVLELIHLICNVIELCFILMYGWFECRC
jgi:hypothetical protein